MVDEFADEQRLDNYWVHASKDGNRENHYRDTALGAALVHFLGTNKPAAIANFIARVEAELPDMYAWFRDPSLHVTVRGLWGM